MRHKPATLAVHAGRSPGPQGEIAPSIQLSTTFARNSDGELMGEFLYTRHGNSNRSALERCLAELEGGQEAACFSSGSAAAQAMLQSVPPGARIVLGHDIYYGVRSLFDDAASRLGFELVVVDFTNLEAVRTAVHAGTYLVFCESPTNPLVELADIAAVAKMARDAGARLVVDNTWATPVLQQPLALGAHWVLHSTTKYLAGHSDVLGGAIVCGTRDSSWDTLRHIQEIAGAVPSPFDCWLTLRGISTLVIRMKAHVANASALAGWLVKHAAVQRVRYPGLPGDPGHQLARKQMKGPGGMLALEFADRDTAARFVSGLELFASATSLGGVHSLAEHRIAVLPEETSTPPTLVRLSVGIEDVQDLRADLEHALISL